MPHVSPNAHDADLPLRVGTPESFARVAAALHAGGFTEDAVVRSLKLGDLSDLGGSHLRAIDLGCVDPRLALLIRTLLFFEPVTRETFQSLLGCAALDAFVELDVLRPLDESGTRLYASVFLYPIRGYYVASDRPVDLAGRRRQFDDWVFPAIFEGTLDFLRLLDARPADAALELCSGTAIGALMLARHARRAYAVDVTARATHYARFNRRLNGCANVDILQGDLYAPVQGLTFDSIVAHPPYVPALRTQFVYRDGGETGEALMRRIVEGLPRHLRCGGIFFALALNIDTAAAPFERRVRGWLGAAQHEFDIVFAVLQEKAPAAVLKRIARSDPTAATAELARLQCALDAIGATRFAYGALAVRRRFRADARPPSTVRMRATGAPSGADLDARLAP